MNDKVYIHEFIDIIGHNRANYMHHMTANWSPIAQEERHQLCYGVWGVVGTTGRWPEVVNMWEEDGFDGLAEGLRHELRRPDPAGPEARRVVGRGGRATAAAGIDRAAGPGAVDPHDQGAVRRRRPGRRLRPRDVPGPARDAPADFLSLVRDEAVAAYAPPRVGAGRRAGARRCTTTPSAC